MLALKSRYQAPTALFPRHRRERSSSAAKTTFFEDDSSNLTNRHHVETRHRLVEQQHSGFLCKSLRRKGTLALASRYLCEVSLGQICHIEHRGTAAPATIAGVAVAQFFVVLTTTEVRDLICRRDLAPSH